MATLTPRAIRDLVDTAIGDLLGVYTIATNQTTKALFVRGSRQVPKSWKVTGIECVIEEVPDATPEPLLGGAVKVNSLWQLVITSYDTKQTLDEVRLRLFRAFTDIQNAVHLPQTDISYERLTLAIPDQQKHLSLGVI